MDGQVFSGYPLWPYGRSFFPAPGGFFSTEQGAGGVEVHMESFPSQALRWRVGVSHQLSKLHSAQAQLWDGIGYPVFLSKPLGIGHEVFCEISTGFGLTYLGSTIVPSVRVFFVLPSVKTFLFARKLTYHFFCDMYTVRICTYM